MRFRSALALIVACIAGLYGLAYAATFTLHARDQVTGNGTTLLAPSVGTDLVTGQMADRYPFKQAADSLRAVFDAPATDTGVVWVRCLDGAGTAREDSVTGSNAFNAVGTGARGQATGCRSATAVLAAEYHDTTANTGAIQIIYAEAGGDTTNLLARIEPYQVKAQMTAYTVPTGRRHTVDLLRVSASPVYSHFSSAVAVVGIKVRNPSGNWYLADEMLVPATGDDYIATYNPPLEFVAGAQYVVAMGLTSSEVLDVSASLRVGER